MSPYNETTPKIKYIVKELEGDPHISYILKSLETEFYGIITNEFLI